MLADTSVWVEHLRSGDDTLEGLSGRCVLYGHPFVTGEVLMGSLHDRQFIRTRLESLPQLELEPQREVLAFVERYALFSRGIGYVDVNLLCSCYRAGCMLLTRDRRLGEAAEGLRLRLGGV